MKGGYPLGAVLRPDQHPLSRSDLPLHKQRREPACQPRQVPVRRHTPAIALVADHGDIPLTAAKIIKECRQMASHGRSGNIPGKRLARFNSGWTGPQGGGFVNGQVNRCTL
jgi:hypothetical protein